LYRHFNEKCWSWGSSMGVSDCSVEQDTVQNQIEKS
jgi:hypothetical protein